MAFLPVLFFRDLEYTLSIAVGTALGGLWFSGPLDSREVRARKIRHGGGDSWITGHGGPWVLHAEEHFQMRIWWVFAARWRECRRQNRRQAQVQPVWFDSKNMKLSVFNQFGFILGWADSLPDVVDDLLAITAENILRECQFWDFHTLLPTQRKCKEMLKTVRK